MVINFQGIFQALNTKIMVTNCSCVCSLIQAYRALFSCFPLFLYILIHQVFFFKRQKQKIMYTNQKIFDKPYANLDIIFDIQLRSQILIMSSQKPNTGFNYEEQMKSRQERSHQYTSQLIKEVNIVKQLEKLHEQRKKQKAQRIFKKGSMNQFSQQAEQDLDVPVDGQLERGSRIFMQNCSSCHSMQPSSKGNFRGPALGLIFNKKIGSDKDYEAYSQALIQKQGYWSAGNLYNFMFNPSKFIFGSRCNPNNNGLQSQQDRADLIAFFKQYSYQLSKNLRIRQVKQGGYSFLQTKLYADAQEEKIRKADSSRK